MSAESHLIKPEHLNFGDTVGIVAPASAPPDASVIDRYAAALQKLGFKAKLSANLRNRLGFLAGTDAERAADLMAMFTDPEVKAIFCLRGGYGSARILRSLDFHQIKKHPKIFLGFSDITSLHCAFLSHARLVSFHGPTLNTEFTDDNPPQVVIKSLFRTLMDPAPAGSICAGCDRAGISVVRSGIASGRLVGGNLSVLCTTLGTPYQPSFKDNIFFFEDVGEDPYRLDRMLTHLLNAGLLDHVAGVAVGVNHNCDDPKAKQTTEFRQTVMDVLADRLMPLGVPVVAGLPFGHVPINMTLPMGLQATLDGAAGDLIITESAVV